MTKAVMAAVAMLSGLALAGCAAETPEQYNAGRGALIGGTTGALIGGLATGRPAGALAGAAIGAGSGAILGAASTARPLPPPPIEEVGPGPGQRRCLKRGFDEYGEPVCLRVAPLPGYQ